MNLKIVVRSAYTDSAVKTIRILIKNGGNVAAWAPGCMEDLDDLCEKHKSVPIVTSTIFHDGTLTIYCTDK